MRNSIKILNAGLDETKDGAIILRGVIDPSSLGLLEVDDYQREVLPKVKINKLVEAIQTSTVPDIEVGMRGENYTVRDGIHYLTDPVFIVDGLQRVTAARRWMEADPKAQPRIGVAVHFDTTREWERERFIILNTLRDKTSPNVILRDRREEFPVIESLYRLSTEDPNFVLNKKISWTQRMSRGQLVSAIGFAKVVAILHSFSGPGRTGKIAELLPMMQTTYSRVGVNVFVDNVREFYRLIDEAWNIHSVFIQGGATHLRYTFMWALANFFAGNGVFWKGHRLVVEPWARKRLAQFNPQDPQVSQLATSGGKAGDILGLLLGQHMTTGKGGRKLQSRTFPVRGKFQPRYMTIVATQEEVTN